MMRLQLGSREQDSLLSHGPHPRVGGLLAPMDLSSFLSPGRIEGVAGVSLGT